MDFPVNLENAGMVSSMEELKQCLWVLLKEEQGQFLQDRTLGSRVKIHSSDNDLIEECIRASVSQIKGVVITNINIIDNNAQLVIKYQDEIVEFQFNVDEVYG